MELEPAIKQLALEIKATLTLSPKQKAGTIKLHGTPLKTEEEVTYLGVIYDKKQTWRPHIQKAEGKARRKISIMRKLAGTTWGANETILKRVYEGAVRPHLEYGSPAWSTASKTHLQALDTVQDQALRVITGAMRSTPIKTMEETVGIQPLSDRRDAKIMVQAEKYRCLPNHPMKHKLGGLTKNRLKRSSFVHESKRLNRVYKEPMPSKTLPLNNSDIPQPWKEGNARVEIMMTVSQTSLPSLPKRCLDEFSSPRS